MSATVTTIPISLRERARQACEVADAEDRRTLESERGERLATLVHRLLEGLRETLCLTSEELDAATHGTAWVESLDPDYDGEELPLLTIDEMVFAPWFGRGSAIALVKRCPACERLVPTVVTSLAVLARAVDARLIHTNCPEAKLETSRALRARPDARLIQALGDYIREATADCVREI